MERKLKKISNFRNNQFGASMLEFALVVPVLFLIILAYIDFTRYNTIQGMLETSANRALAYASTLPGLEGSNILSTEFDADKKQQVIDKAKDFALKTVVSDGSIASSAMLVGDPVLTLGFIEEDNKDDILRQPMTQNLENYPLQVQIVAKYDSILFGDLNIYATAAGMREPHSGVFLPVPVDCRGNRLGSDDFFKDCPCEPESNMVWESSLKRCTTCPNYTYAKEGPGREPSNKSTIPAGCFCPLKSDCESKLGAGALNNNCTCSCSFKDGWKLNKGKCVCRYSKAEKVVNGDGVNQCVCTGDNAYDQQKCNDTYEGNVKVVGLGCACGCVNDCGVGRKKAPVPTNDDKTSCQCECKSGFKLNAENRCECEDPKTDAQCGVGKKWNPKTCECECKAPCNKTLGKLNKETCTCECLIFGTIPDKNGYCPEIEDTGGSGE